MDEINLTILTMSESQLEYKIKSLIREVLNETIVKPPIIVQDNDDLVKIDEIVKLTGYKKGYVYQLVNEGKIPFHKVGRSLRFSRKEIQEWLRAGRSEVVRDDLAIGYIKNAKKKLSK